MTSDRNSRRKVLIIGMFDSVHVARWLVQFRDEDIDFRLVPSGPHRRIHPILKSLSAGETTANFELMMSRFYTSLFIWILDRLAGTQIRGHLVKRVIENFRPDLVHALEMQNAGYTALVAYKRLGRPQRPKLIVTNYGSDIFWFSRFSKHKNRITELLEVADFYSCECERDLGLAIELGFKGTSLPVFPNSGGIAAESTQESQAPSQRHSLAIKGYQGWAGKANIVLEALGILANEVRPYKLEIYSCNLSVMWKANRLRKSKNLDVRTYSKGSLSHREMLSLFRRSLLYVGISTSDGISTSLLEAMACGAIPVQTSTACCDEWFADTGVRVDTISPEAVAEAILTALELARDPSNAERNRQTIREKASEEQVKAAALQYYR